MNGGIAANSMGSETMSVRNNETQPPTLEIKINKTDSDSQSGRARSASIPSRLLNTTHPTPPPPNEFNQYFESEMPQQLKNTDLSLADINRLC